MLRMGTWYLHRQTMTPVPQKKRILAEKQGEQKKDVKKIELAYYKAHQEMVDQSKKARTNVGHVIHSRLERTSNPINVLYCAPLKVLQRIHELQQSSVH